MARKFYVVWAGRQTGIFTTWADTKKQVHQFPKARFKSFKTLEEAEAAYAGDRADITIKCAKDKARTHWKKSRAIPNAPIEEQIDLDSTVKTIFDVNIYCDGACDPNPGEAGSGIAIYRNGELAELWYGLYNPHGTNNSAELNALYQALHFAKVDIEKGNEVQILCDSKYSIDCVTNWAFNWERRGWRRKKDGDIKNLTIIQQAHELYKEI
jgi:ribonuclease HI